MVGHRHQLRELVHSDGNVGLEEVAEVGVEEEEEGEEVEEVEEEEEKEALAPPVNPILYSLHRDRELSPLMT